MDFCPATCEECQVQLRCNLVIFRIRGINFRFQYSRLKIPDSRFPHSRFQIPDSNIPDSRFQHSRLKIPDSRFPTPDSRLLSADPVGKLHQKDVSRAGAEEAVEVVPQVEIAVGGP